ncbi:serine-rich adhesin for platelets [Battus philenor]|uniref:serine-rich adhesin for platelets n=1 Tax=Battus philenor TaxID=42288 RepID=UPI0035D00797
MSADDKEATCPTTSEQISDFVKIKNGTSVDGECEKTTKARKVSFPKDQQLVTKYFEPANPWQDVPPTTRAQLAAEYLEACRRHRTPPIDSVLQQIRELPDNAIGGGARAPRLALSECSLQGCAPADALEAVLRKVQFRRLELDHVEIDDEGAEAMFDMVEYYESTNVVCVMGPRNYGIRGWQATSRMVKKSAELTELEVSDGALEASHASVLARSLRPAACPLRSLCLQRAQLSGEPLLCLVIALKSNSSVRELRLGDNRLSVGDASQLASLLRFNTRLQLLDLSNNLIQDAGVAQIAEALVEQSSHTPPSAATSPMSPHHCPISGYDSRGLAFLVLWNNQLTRNCAVHLGKVLRTSQSLCVLNVGRNALGSEAVRVLQEGGVGALVSLGLQAARLGPDAARPLASLLTNSALQRLDLRDNKLGSAGLQAILDAMKDNTTITQIDLDDPPEGSATRCEEAALAARVTRDIRAACRRNAPPAERLHRKISLTCHTACFVRSGGVEEERRPSVRLRSPAPSPAPSPAGSPVPLAQHSRFSVTRVTPDRDSSDSSSPSTPTRPTYCPTPSRFKVVQVAEPPQIQVHPATQPRRNASRFSVTRNYDSMYSPALSPSPASTASPSPEPPTATPSPEPTKPETHGLTKTVSEPTIYNKQPEINLKATQITPAKIYIDPVVKENRDILLKSTEPVWIKPSLDEVKNKPIEVTANNAQIAKNVDSVRKIARFETRLIPYDQESANIITAGNVKSVPEAISVIQEKPVLPRPEVKVTDVEQVTCKLKEENKISQEPIHVETVINASASKLPKGDVISDLRETTVISLGFKENPVIDEKHNAGNVTETCRDSTLKDINVIIGEVSDTKDEAKRSDSIVVEDILTDKLITSDNSEKVQSIVADDATKATVTDGDRCSNISDIINSSDISETVSQVKSENISHEQVVSLRGDRMANTETELVKTSVEMCKTEIVDVEVDFTIKCETVQSSVNIENSAKVHRDQNVNNIEVKVDEESTSGERADEPIKHIEEVAKDLGNIIQGMQDLTKTRDVKVKSDCTQTEGLELDSNLDSFNNVPVKVRDVVLKKNKSESSLDSPDLEVSRLMNKKLIGSAFCDSSSSLEISGSSMESLNAMDNQNQQISRPIIIHESAESDTELDRRRDVGTLSTESSIESTSDTTPVNSGFLNMSVSSNESVSPIIFGGKKIHGSLSSLEASMSSLESARQERVMVTSADSGIEYSLQNPSENKEDASSNEGTLTHNSSLRETVRKPDIFQVQETLTSPKRTSSLLDVPALKSKGLDRMRKISWVAPSSSFHIPRPEPEKIEMKLPSHLEKLLSLFQHPSSLFSRSSSSHSDDEKKSASSTPPRKDSTLTSSFWSWGSATEKTEKDDDSLSEATDSTLSERVQVSFVDESFSKKLDSKTPSTDTDNTLSEFQSFPAHAAAEVTIVDRVTEITTDDHLVQRSLDVSVKSVNSAGSNGNKPRASDNTDLIQPNDLNRNVYDTPSALNAPDEPRALQVKLEDTKQTEVPRPRSFAAVLKASGSENSLEKQPSPDTGPPVDKLPSKVIRGIKENISPENTLTSSMTNTRALALELYDKQKKPVSTLWEVTSLMEKAELKVQEIKTEMAPIATVEEICDEAADNCVQLAYIDDDRAIDESNLSADSGVTSLETIAEKFESRKILTAPDLENVDVGKDALSYLIYENQDFEPDTEHSSTGAKSQQGSLAQELSEAENREHLVDLSPELVIDEAVEVPEVFMVKEIKGLKSSPVIPERAKLKKSNSLEDLSRRLAEMDKDSPKTKTIAFKVPETTTPRDIPERRVKFRTRSGSSPKSLPESLNKPCPLTKMDTGVVKKKKKSSCLGRMARDSLLALNMSEEETAEFRSYKLTSVESLKSLESVSEDANSQSGTSMDSRCRSCLRTSQESLMSLDSINEDCKCMYECEKRAGQSNR